MGVLDWNELCHTESFIPALESLVFLVKAAVKCWNLQINKILNTIQTEFFQFLSSLLRTYLWDIHNLKNNTTVSRSGYLYGVNSNFSLTNAFCFSLNWRYFSEMQKKINSLLSKSTWKYIVCCQVFWIEVWSLQDQCISIYMGVGV